VGEVAALHLKDGEARGIAAEVYCCYDTARRGVDRDGQGAEADFVLLVDEGVAVAADVAQGETELFDRGDSAGGVRREDCFREVLLKLLGGQICEEYAAHTSAVGGETAADVEIDSHDSADLGAGDVDDVFAVERGD